MNCEGEPVEDNVEEILLAIIPLLPIPVKIILPFVFFKIFIAFTKLLLIELVKAFKALFSVDENVLPFIGQQQGDYRN